MRFEDVNALEAALAEESYLADRGLAVSVFLALTLRRPLLLEGEPGVGKTEVARTLARVLDAELIRLQCYEGIDAGQALYEWDYSRQLLYARTIQDGQLDPSRRAAELYGPEFLVERPLLRAVRAGAGAVLLVDELDRADEEFEAFLLEVLADSAVTIPEIGTVTAEQPPVVVLTSNRTRELHDALKRRCLYHWIDYPTLEREMAIIRLRAPEASEALARSVAEVVARLREMDLIKRPGPAEAIDWSRALAALGIGAIDAASAGETLGWVVKNRDDLTMVRRRAAGAARGVSDLAIPLALAHGLREAGVPVGTGRILSFARAAASLGPGDLYWAGRATLISRREDIPAFDRAFEDAFGIVGPPSPRPSGWPAAAPASSPPATCR